MVTNIDSGLRSAREHLNQIAAQRQGEAECSVNEWQADVRDYGQILHRRLEDQIRTYSENTPLTQLEAEVWVLYRSDNEETNFLTLAAISLLYSISGTGFEISGQADGEASAVDSEDVERIYSDARKKYSEGNNFVEEVFSSKNDHVIDLPRKVWLGLFTLKRLEKRRQPGEQTVEEIVTRLLAESRTRRPFDEFIEEYIQARGRENVLEITIELHDFVFGEIWIKSCTSVDDELPDVVLDTDVVTIEGHPHWLQFEEEPSTDVDLSHRKLYVSDRILGRDSVELETGIAAMEDHVRTLMDEESIISQAEKQIDTP